MTLAAYNNDAVWGLGATEDAARADVVQWIDMDDERNVAFIQALDFAEMTPELEAQINVGNPSSFGRLPDGRIGTYDQHYAAIRAA